MNEWMNVEGFELDNLKVPSEQGTYKAFQGRVTGVWILF